MKKWMLLEILICRKKRCKSTHTKTTLSSKLSVLLIKSAAIKVSFAVLTEALHSTYIYVHDVNIILLRKI